MTDRSIYELESARLGAEQRDQPKRWDPTLSLEGNSWIHYRPTATAPTRCGIEPTRDASVTTSANIQAVSCPRCLTLTAAGA